MLIKIIVLASIVIISLIGGSIIALKIFNKPAESSAISAVIKANNVVDTLTISYNDSVQLSWESNNAIHCEISGDWLGIVPDSGSQLIGNVTEAKNYLLLCIDEKKETVLSSVAVYIDEKTIPANITSTASILNRESFKDFTYTWKKNFGFGLKDDQDVAALQTILYLESLLPSSDQITGNFDDQTMTALKKFQELYDIEQTGYAGNKTISKLNELYGAKIPTYSSTPSVSSGRDAAKPPAPTKTESSDSYSQNILQDILGLPAKLIEKIAAPNSIIKPTVDIKADNSDGPITVEKNSSVTLSWTSSDAESCVGYGGWSGNQSLNGSISTEFLTNSKYYTLICKNSDGVASDSVFIKILYSASGSYSGSYAIPPSDATSTTSDTNASSAENDEFQGVVTEIIPCLSPDKNSALILVGKKGGKFIWVAGESQSCLSENICFSYTMPEKGMWGQGNLDEEVDCEAAGSGKKIIHAEYGF